MRSHSLIPAPIAELPWRMLLLVTFITGFGLLVLYSAAGAHLMPWALPQAVRFILFLSLAIAISRVPIQRLKAFAFPAYGGVLLLLILVEALGFVTKGAQRWLSLGFMNLQPSELMKPVIILAVARFYDLLPVAELRRFNALWPAAAMIGIPAGLILIQPDLGTAVMVVAGGITVMFLAGLPLRLFAGGAAFLAVAGPVAFSFLHEYQRQRVLIFMNPEADPSGAGYHIRQSQIAIGSGGLFGKGFLNGTQSHLQYLPENHTDFIFATMAEEWGLLGGVLIIVAYALVIKWGIGVALEAKDRFSRLTAAGLTTTIFFYVAINLMMVMGLAPVVGIPLPLVSYGGSAMLTVMLCLGALMAIERSGRKR
ncbi:MAG: rod shape determining protein RodA [Sphingomonadales bacterium]|nr:rod shape determining protein RodA [Sphingomonadales bacterium]